MIEQLRLPAILDIGRLTDSAPVTEPCPTCGKDAVAETLTVLRDGVTYRQTIWRCPSSRKKKKPTYTNRKFIRPACPVRKTEEVIEMPNPTGKNGRAASVRPNPQDIEEYHRLKEKLGLKNRVLKELSGVRDAAVYDWLAGRLVTEDVNARMMAALAQIRKNNLRSEIEVPLLEVGPLENLALGSGRPPAPASGGVGFLPYDQIPTADEIGQWAKDGFAKTFGASDNAENIEQSAGTCTRPQGRRRQTGTGRPGQTGAGPNSGAGTGTGSSQRPRSGG